MSLEFPSRHIGPDAAEQARMLSALGYLDLDAFTADVVPEIIRWHDRLELPAAASEPETIAELAALAERNRIVASMIGLGYHPTHTPAVITRNILENPAWYTAYTPYQPEISQGRLEALLNFQTLIEDLTGLPVAGSSLLDEPTAVAEAMALAVRSVRGAMTVAVDHDTHPQTIAVLQTRAEPLGIRLVVGDLESGLPEGDLAAVIVSNPGTSGRLRDVGPLIEAAHARSALAIVNVDLLSLTLVAPPGELGADIVVGSAQRFGVPMGFGGPHAGFMSVRSGLERSMPGRLVGVSVDADGRPAYRLALQTREQHIRREKATSNICTAQVLLAVIASMYAVYHGPEGLLRIAERTHEWARHIATGIRKAGGQLTSTAFFDTVRWSAPGQADRLVAAALDEGINIRRSRRGPVACLCDGQSRSRRAGSGRRRDIGSGDSGGSGSHLALSAASGVLHAPQRDIDAALHPATLGSRCRARPVDDSAGLLHDEIERDYGDGAGHLAGLRVHPPVRTAGSGGWLRRPHPPARGVARRSDGL
jgi:glycine dehydrogenase